ncbi:hypothetical protein Tco_0138354 [Tanacetum coccineum]
MQQPIPNPGRHYRSHNRNERHSLLMARQSKLNYSTPTNNNQRILSNPRNRQIAQPVQNVGNRGLVILSRTAHQPEEGIAAYLQTSSSNRHRTQTDNAPSMNILRSTSNPIPEPHQEQQNDSNVISDFSSVEQEGEQGSTSCNVEGNTKLKSDFKIREDELLDKQIQLENKIKELDNILVKTGQSIQTMHMLSPKPDSFYHTEQKMALGYQNPFYLKQAQQKQQSLYNGKVLLEKHDPPAVYDSKETLQLAQESRLKMK